MSPDAELVDEAAADFSSEDVREELERLPSEYFRDNVYMKFQDDWIAFKFKDECNV